MRTLLVGNFGAKNVGDELILLAALQDYPNATVMTADSAWTQQFCESSFKTVDFPPTAFRSFFKYCTSSTYRQRVKALAGKFDTVVFAGGGLFAIKMRACVLWWLVFKWLKRLNPQAEFRFENQGIDAGLGWLSKKLMTSVMSQADYISVRDEASRNQLQRVGVSSVLVTDRVWSSNLFTKQAHLGKHILVNARAPMALVVFNRLKCFDGLVFVAFEASDLAYVPKNWPGTVVLPKNVTELNAVFALAECLVGERLHSLLFASKKLGADNVQLLRDPYAEKVGAFAQELGWKTF